MWPIDRKESVKLAIRVATIIAVTIIIVLTLPKVGTFQYEYQEGFPWRYETLYAPFDFPIYKTDAEIENERNLAAKESFAIFNIHPEVGEMQVARIGNAISKYLPPRSDSYKSLMEVIESAYERGIIQIPESMRNNLPINIKVVENNHGRTAELSSFTTGKETYLKFQNRLKELNLPESTTKKLNGAGISALLLPNIEYDAEKTESEIERNVEEIATTYGMVRRDEQIIAKHEVVTSEKERILKSLDETYSENAATTLKARRVVTGQTLFILLAITIYSLFFIISKRELFNSNKGFFLIYAAILGMALFGALAFHYEINFYALPVLFFVIIINILLGNRPALYLLISGGLILSTFAPNGSEYLALTLTAGIVGIFTLSSLQRRGQLFLTSLWIFITYSICFIAIRLKSSGEFHVEQLQTLLWFAVNSLLLTLTYPLLYLFERTFGYTSEITLIELSNPHHPALKELTKKAPGTFQHSLIVANMAEAAIEKIGGNALLTRTGALYHDIGKCDQPFLFIENQSGGVNPHDSMDFDESAQKIIAHVENGVRLAKHYRLPEEIVDFIRTHHGRSRVKYFYNSFRNKYPDREIDEELFTYKGPDPTTKECAVVMMADAVEAVVRTLDEKGEESISNAINTIIDSQIAEGRFENSDITFKEIAIIKETFLETLTSIYHSRVAYPKLKSEEES